MEKVKVTSKGRMTLHKLLSLRATFLVAIGDWLPEIIEFNDDYPFAKPGDCIE